MLIKVKYLGLMNNKVRKKEEEIELREGLLILDLLEKLAEKYGEQLKNLFFVKKGKGYILQPAFLVTVNGILTIQLNGMNAKLNNEDSVSLMMTVSGG